MTETAQGMTIARAVALVREVCAHTGPVLICVDELKKSAHNREDRVQNLSQLTAVLDENASKPEHEHIYFSVSVIVCVVVGSMMTYSKRLMLHQPLDPIIPIFWEGASVERLPQLFVPSSGAARRCPTRLG